MGLAKSRTPIDKRVDVKDAQLRGTAGFDVFIDDIDLQQTTFTNAADFAYGFGADQGAFVYVNSVNNTVPYYTIQL